MTYLEGECQEEDNPRWGEETARGAIAVSLGKFGLAYAHAVVATQVAKGPAQKGIACHNISDILRRWGYPQLAIDWSKQAVALDPENLSRWSVLALSLLESCRESEGRKVLARAAELANLDDPRDALRINLTYEDAYRRFQHIDVVAELLETISTKEGGTR